MHHVVPQATTPTTGMNNAQLALAYHCFSCHKAHKGGAVDKAFVARFMHMVTGKQYTKLNNSDLYLQLRRLPALLKNKKNIQELLQLFEAFGLQELSKILTDND